MYHPYRVQRLSLVGFSPQFPVGASSAVRLLMPISFCYLVMPSSSWHIIIPNRKRRNMRVFSSLTRGWSAFTFIFGILFPDFSRRLRLSYTYIHHRIQITPFSHVGPSFFFEKKKPKIQIKYEGRNGLNFLDTHANI